MVSHNWVTNETFTIHFKVKNVKLEKQNSNWSENLIDKIFPHEWYPIITLINVHS